MKSLDADKKQDREKKEYGQNNTKEQRRKTNVLRDILFPFSSGFTDQ